MPIRVLVVDDSATMRGLITATLQADPEISVVGSAADPLQARQAIKMLSPDVITLDIEMPNMDGLEFLEKIMRLRPTPVIMISTLTQRGAEVTLQALELGAFDCVAKPQAGQPDSLAALVPKVKAAARQRRLYPLRATAAPVRNRDFTPDGKIIGIGSSTGGVEALINILSSFPENCPPTLISQHMPVQFTKSFAERLNKLCLPHVAEAQDGAALLPGHVYLAPGDTHLTMTRGQPARCRLNHSERVNGHRPSADVMFKSIAQAAGSRAVGVILTGMGRDGAEGLLALREAGAATLGQDEMTSVVYGMPKVAFEIGAVEAQYPLDRIAANILARCDARGTAAPGQHS
jgi:two-component system chemotaxis response regulator CheB